MALHFPEICFLLAKTIKNLNFLRCIHVLDLVLKCGSDKNEGNLIQLLFHFFVLVNVAASLSERMFFICSLGFKLNLFHFPVLPKRLHLDSKTWSNRY